jgi:hypothetical protein
MGDASDGVVTRRPPSFWVGAAIGWAVIAYGLRGLWHHRLDTRPANLARFVVGGALIHDLLLAPVVLLLGIALSRIVPPAIRAVVQGALIVSACLALFSWPLVRDYARVLHNPSSLPHNYTANLGIAIGLVWLVAAALAAAKIRKARVAPGEPDATPEA